MSAIVGTRGSIFRRAGRIARRCARVWKDKSPGSEVENYSKRGGLSETGRTGGPRRTGINPNPVGGSGLGSPAVPVSRWVGPWVRAGVDRVMAGSFAEPVLPRKMYSRTFPAARCNRCVSRR